MESTDPNSLHICDTCKNPRKRKNFRVDKNVLKSGIISEYRYKTCFSCLSKLYTPRKRQLPNEGYYIVDIGGGEKAPAYNSGSEWFFIGTDMTYELKDVKIIRKIKVT